MRWDPIVGLILTFFGLAMIGGLAWAYYYNLTNPGTNEATLCPAKGPLAVHLVLIDHSDAVTAQQAQFVRQSINRLKSAAKVGTRFDVFTFTGDPQSELSPEISICVPGRPEDADPLTQNPERVRKLYEDKFSTALDRTVARLLSQSSQPTSPIIESLRAAAQTSFGPLEDSVPMQVTLISDMVQHSAAASHLRSEPKFEPLSRSSIWPSLKPKLMGAAVDVLYVLRSSALRDRAPVQNRGHQHFWEQLIRASGGVMNSIEPF